MNIAWNNKMANNVKNKKRRETTIFNEFRLFIYFFQVIQCPQQ